VTSLARGPTGPAAGWSPAPDGAREPGRARNRTARATPRRGLPAWLRASCPCADCLTRAAARQAAIADLPTDVTVAEVPHHTPLLSDLRPDSHRASLPSAGRQYAAGGEAGTE
jgi:hypothetical protein